MRRIIGALGEHRDGLGLELKTTNAISYPDEPGLRKPDSLHFFRIFKEQPNKLIGQRAHARSPIDSWIAGGANRDRTGDLLLAKQALSQLSYGPLKLRRLVAGAQLYVVLLKSVGGSGWT